MKYRLDWIGDDIKKAVVDGDDGIGGITDEVKGADQSRWLEEHGGEERVYNRTDVVIDSPCTGCKLLDFKA